MKNKILPNEKINLKLNEKSTKVAKYYYCIYIFIISK